MKEERIGIEFTTNEGYQVIVIDYVNTNKVQVMFLDEHKWTMWTTWQTLQKKGSLKNPFHPSVYGVGYLGVMENGERPIISIKGKNTREYECWHGMLRRCYDEKYHETRPTYKNCTVCERWHSFVNFLEDISGIKNYELWRDNPNSGVTLNKDIYYVELGIDTDCKEYSLETTRFITKDDSIKEMIDRAWKKRVKCIETGKEYDSIIQASEDTGVSDGGICMCCKGSLSSVKGLHFEYVE